MTEDSPESADPWLDAALSQLDPPHIPMEVSARIVDALAVESETRSAAAAGIAPIAPRRRRWIWAAAGVAAAGLVATALVVDRADAPIPATVAGGQWAGLQTIPVSTGSDYSEANVDALVQRFLRSPALPVAPPDTVSRTFAASEAGMSACLSAVGYSPDDLAMLDIARYGSRPVAVMAYLDGTGDPTADVVVVGTGCSANQPDVHLRHVTTLAQRGGG